MRLLPFFLLVVSVFFIFTPAMAAEDPEISEAIEAVKRTDIDAPPAAGTDADKGRAGTSLWLHERAGSQHAEFNDIWEYRPSLVTTVYARNGSVLGYLYREKRFLVALEDLNPSLVNAFLAAEDSSFYEHEGLDLTAIFRALGKNLTAGDIVQGASTITQQVVKRLLLTSEKSYARKIKEAILAYRLEHQMSKHDILTIYLNEIFFGANAYGVEAAARTYFAKHAGELNLAEAALLAGLPKAPTRYNPYRYPDAAKARQQYVLGRMLELQWITQAEYDEAKAYELVFQSMGDPSWTLGAYYLEEVRRWLMDEFPAKIAQDGSDTWGRTGKDIVYEAGLEVYTAIDLDHQRYAEQALQDGLVASTKRRGWQGPLAQLQAGEFDTFLEKNPLPDDAAPGVWVKALVLSVDKSGAAVRVGRHKGSIGVKSMSWCRKPNPRVSPEGAGKIQDARKVLQPGDVVWAALTEEPVEGQPLKLDLTQQPKVQGALVSIEPHTGDVVALVGGYDFQTSQFNRATQAIRQPGSAFKPIVYSAALDAGFTPASVVMDEPFVYLDPYTMELWQPKNYSGEYYGPTMLCTALAKSRNLVTIRVADMIGIQRVIKRAKSLGLVGDFQPYLPVSLGSVAVSPMNLCQAYTAFARDGSYVTPRLVLSVKNQMGSEVYRSTTESHEAISPQNAYIMANMLKQVVIRGTAARARKLGRPFAGKTGTTNDEQDAWFIGFSPYLLTGVYVGFDQVTPMGRLETGSRAALPIWMQYREHVEPLYHEQDFTPPSGVVFQHVYTDGYPAEEGGDGTYYLPFMADNLESSFFAGDVQFGYDQSYVLDGEYKQGYEQYDYNKDKAPDQEEYLLKQLF